MTTMGRWGWAAVIWGATGCGGVDPEQACEDFLDALGDGLSSCGYGSDEVSEGRAAAERALGGCSSVVAVRDEDALYSSCLPSLRRLDCEDVASGDLVVDSSCDDQLVRE